jgi:fumarate reductase flavoprotein subunit
MTRLRSADVVVIGAGLAGLTAAIRASETGLSVLALEAGADERYMCNSRISMGFINVAGCNIANGPTVLQQAIAAVTHEFADPSLAEALANNAGSALVWLRRQGARTIVGNWRPGSDAMLAPPAAIGPGLNWWGRGPDQMLRNLESVLSARGGRLLRGVRGRELVINAGRCVGVMAETVGGRTAFDAHAVVIADGGFQANARLLQEHVTPRPDRVLLRNARTGRGDGLLMALEAGAATRGMGGFYGHVQSRDALTNPRLWPYPTVDMPITAGIVVDALGRRFADEGLGGIYMANAIARQPDPLGATAVLDHRGWMTRATEFPIPANPHLLRAGATIHVASDITTLANQAGLPADALNATVITYNQALVEGRGLHLTPPRSPRVWTPAPINTAPFYAIPLVAGLTYTTGGIAIDAQGRVLTSSGSVIEGLYAAGSCTGGHEGGPQAGYTGGLGKALTFGWIAGHSVVSYILRKAA